MRGLSLMFRSPERFEQLATKDAAQLPSPDPSHHFAQAARHVRRGISESLAWVLATVIAGWLGGEALEHFVGRTSPVVNHALQYAGVGIILWATLAIQGWSIQTINGNSLPERLNRAIYRALYLVGSFLLVLSVAWPTAAGSAPAVQQSVGDSVATLTAVSTLLLVLVTGALAVAAFLGIRQTSSLEHKREAARRRAVATTLRQEVRRIRGELGEPLTTGQTIAAVAHAVATREAQPPHIHSWLQRVIPQMVETHATVFGLFFELDRDLDNYAASITTFRADQDQFETARKVLANFHVTYPTPETEPPILRQQVDDAVQGARRTLEQAVTALTAIYRHCDKTLAEIEEALGAVLGS